MTAGGTLVGGGTTTGVITLPGVTGADLVGMGLGSTVLFSDASGGSPDDDFWQERDDCGGVEPCVGSQTGDTGKNAEILRKNMTAAGNPPPHTVGWAAHHIVQSTQKGADATRSRRILARFRIDINDATNGVWLRHGRPHLRWHTNRYRENVFERLQSGLSRDNVIQILSQIRSRILNNIFPR